MSDVGQTLEVGDATARIANALDEKELGVLVYVLGIFLSRLLFGPSHSYAQAGKQSFEKTVGAAVEVD